MGLTDYLAHKASWVLHGFDAPWNREDFSFSGFVVNSAIVATAVTALFLNYGSREINNGFDKLDALGEPNSLFQGDSGIYSNSRERFTGVPPYVINTPLSVDSGSVYGTSFIFRDSDFERDSTSL